MSDEIYHRLLFDGREHATLFRYPAIADRLIVLDGWSKTYAMTGWRLGWSVWPKSIVGEMTVDLCAPLTSVTTSSRTDRLS